MISSQAQPVLSRKIQALHGGAETSFTRMLRMAGGVPNLISLGRGDPDLPTPPHIIQAAVDLMQSRHVNYTPPPGMPTLREAIVKKMATERGLTYDPVSEVVVTAGAQEAISVVMQTLLDPGDEVLLPDPYYTAYEMATGLAYGKVVRVPTRAEDNFEVQPEAIEAAITPAWPRLLVLVSPNNPTGGIISRTALGQIADIALRHNLIVVSDELYERIIFDGATSTSIATLPAMRERTVVINGFSKTYCMTGFRVGYLVGPAALVTPMQEPHHILTICAPTASQHAALAALEGPQDCVEEIVSVFAERRQVLMDNLSQAGIPYPYPAGAFFVFADVATGMTSADFAVKVLQEAGVLVFPGTQYGPGGEGFLRISYLAEIPDIKQAVEKLGQVYRETVAG